MRNFSFSYDPKQASDQLKHLNYKAALLAFIMLNNSERSMDKILVVDDDALGRHNVVYFLRLKDYAVDEACDGNQAVLLLDQVKFDLVLSDVMMPGLNGIALLAHIRSVAPDIPVLLMSGFTPVEGNKIIKLGAVDFIMKPLDLDVLLSKIRRILNLRSSG